MKALRVQGFLFAPLLEMMIAMRCDTLVLHKLFVLFT